MIEKIEFIFLGLELLEPMAMVTNLLVVASCVYGFFQIKHSDFVFWKHFFLLFAIASFAGGLSHLFWNYWWFYGKIVPWFFGVASTSYLSLAMIKLFRWKEKTNHLLAGLVLLKAVVVLSLAYLNWNFLIVAIDTIASLILACGVGSAVLLFNKQRARARYILYGVLAILPAAIIFLLKFDAHLWLNREDLSHVFIAFGLLFFAKFASAERPVLG